MRVPFLANGVVMADGDQPRRPEVHVDLDQRTAEGDDVHMILEALHGGTSYAAMGLVERSMREAVLIGQHFQLLDGGGDDIDPRHGRLSTRFAEGVRRLHRTMSVGHPATRVVAHGSTGRRRRKAQPAPGVVRFETNRSLTGMGHERFTSVTDAIGPRPAAMLARQLLATGKVDSV